MPSNDSNDQAIEDRRWKAWDLRIKGKSYRAIGDALGVSGKTAHQDCQAVLARVIDEANENAAQDRAVSLYRLDRALDIVEQALGAEVFTESGERDHELRLKAVDRLVKIDESRRKLLGTDAPMKHEIDANVTSAASPGEAARLVRQAFGEHASQKSVDESVHTEPAASLPESTAAG